MGPIQADDVEVRINVKSKKFNRLLELFNKRKRISFEMVAKSLKIVSTGMITEVSYSEEGCIGFTYCPEVFSIL